MSENINVNDEVAVTGLQTNYPPILNGVTYKYLKTWNVTHNDYVTVHETEGGTQEEVVARKGRKSISVSGVVLQPLLANLVALADLDEFQAKIYNVLTDAYDTIDVRVGAGSMSYSLKEKSADLETVNGVWNVSFKLEEF